MRQAKKDFFTVFFFKKNTRTMNTAYEEIVMGKMVNHNNHTEEELKALQQKSRSKLKTSIIVSILLFPVAIASIVKSSIAVKKADEGNYLEAMKLCDDAQKYIKISIILGIVNYALCIIYIILEIILIAEMSNHNYYYNDYYYY